MSRLSTFRRHLPVTLLMILLSGVYLSTLAPGLTWANAGSDGGDLITAAYTGGIAHPTGYPLYLLLARLFQVIPMGSLAYRTNLMSAVFTVLAAAVLQKTVTRALNDQNLPHGWLAGLAAGCAFGFAPLVWSQAVITEVHALQAFLTALILYIFIFPTQRTGGLLGLVLGLAMGNHVTTIFLTPLLFFPRFRERAGLQAGHPASSLTWQLVWFAIGLSLYLTLPLRALTHPPLNWGNPLTPGRLWWLVSGGVYQSYYLQLPFDGFGERLGAWASLLLQQFGWAGVLLGIFGLVLLFKPTPLYGSTVWVAFTSSAFALTYSANDSFLYLIPMYISFAVWIGLGIGNALGRLPSGAHLLLWGTGALLAGYLVFRVHAYAGRVDASQDFRAERFGSRVMAEVPQDALVFLKGDQAVFTAWYFHFALGQRPDAVFVAEELLHFDWYQETLRDTYPALDVPGPLPWAQNVADANPARPVCFVDYLGQAEINCIEMAGFP